MQWNHMQRFWKTWTQSNHAKFADIGKSEIPIPLDKKKSNKGTLKSMKTYKKSATYMSYLLIWRCMVFSDTIAILNLYACGETKLYILVNTCIS